MSWINKMTFAGQTTLLKAVGYNRVTRKTLFIRLGSKKGAVRLMRLTDLSGTEIANEPPASDCKQIDLRSAADGVYLLELESFTGREVHKLIKRRN